MKFDFLPTKTDDGTIGLFNKKFDDVYHCSTGAYSEALAKFVAPSGLLEKASQISELKILDICYGLGYNSKTAVDEIHKINPNCKIIIDIIEIDINVLAFSILLKIPQICSEILEEFLYQFILDNEILGIAKSICKDENFKDFCEPKIVDFIKNRIITTSNYVNELDNSLSLHNIYYRTNSNRNILNQKCPKNGSFLTLNVYNRDLREVLPLLDGEYDAIFHDGFTPIKQPTVWTKQIFDKLFNLLKENGKLVTYSSSSKIRGAMLESGFSICAQYSEDDKSIGTVGFKNNGKQDIIMNEFEKGLLDTTAGIPFYDPHLNYSVDEIIECRNAMVQKSTRIGSSKYSKNLGYK